MNTRPPRERESKVQRSVVVRLRRLGIVLHRRNVATWTATHNGKDRVVACGKKGQADLYGWDLRTARHWEVETKARGKKPTEHQLEWLKSCSAQGCVAYWGDSANIIERVAEAILAGGRVAWHADENFDVEMEQGRKTC